MLTAIKKACVLGKGTITRKKVLEPGEERRHQGLDPQRDPFHFSTKSNDPLNGRFYFFQIQSDGTYKPVAS